MNKKNKWFAEECNEWTSLSGLAQAQDQKTQNTLHPLTTRKLSLQPEVLPKPWTYFFHFRQDTYDEPHTLPTSTIILTSISLFFVHMGNRHVLDEPCI